jgi:hypothetical protein
MEYLPSPLTQARYGFTAAAYERNEKIVKNSQEIVAFWDGSSPGTADTIRLAKKFGKPVKVILPE